MCSDKVTCRTEAASVLLRRTLAIPPYQRPYKWREKQVLQLLEDIYISLEENRAAYRIGAVILHGNDIVDGQQRLITLCSVLYYLGEKDSIGNHYQITGHFPHDISVMNIKQNYQCIKSWFEGKDEDTRRRFIHYLLYQCQIVVIEVKELSQAFQLFDSQNARGKSLEPYDLLKAFHLREMSLNTAEERLQCVKRWEKAVNEGALSILGKYIFRIRRWANNEFPGEFSKDDIDEFKGISVHQPQYYPYQKASLINDALVSGYATNPVMKYYDNKPGYPFQLTQLIINGQRFFEYVHYYVNLHGWLFNDASSPSQQFYSERCFYDGCYRTGDTYVREIYEAALLFYYDKFGAAQWDKIQRILYKWSYRLRLANTAVRYTSVNPFIRDAPGGSVFRIIQQEYYPIKLLKMNPSRPEEIKKPIPLVEEVYPSN
nr:DUF262 domain-containing protein [uncultured Chitinophaga sp.]